MTSSAPETPVNAEAVGTGAVRAERRVGRTRPRSSGDTVGWPPRTAVSRCAGTCTGSSEAKAASNSARPSSGVSGRTPMRVIRSTVASVRVAPMPPVPAHRPHAIERPCWPFARRTCARLSSTALAAA